MTNCVVVLLLIGLCFGFTEAGCKHDGETIEEGTRFDIDCNNCICGKAGAIACTKISCNNPILLTRLRDLSAGGCKYNGKFYVIGQLFKKQCDTCVCLEKGPACYKSGCRS
ncbi:hypothetical protein LOTGIDRAFT_170586 [Lottia gigantea]|uniref:VWFC domain-containing protein n=1 Tax=Lottia gigantea TaxID=225164 RepID=V4CQ78_LOTGI|nr:hypothetical protein LOTGIDRAFT_170586 [Lottia gigantea]ESP04615.1 hypothetical protein LOTGIDRAFT_170586 [Lottia gigantea]